MPKLLIELPNGSAQLVPLKPARTTLGRALDNDIALDDPRVSRSHAAIDVEGSFHVVKDLGSKNGIFINGHRVQARALNGAASFELGDCKLSLIADEDVHDIQAEAIHSVPGLQVDFVDAPATADSAVLQAGHEARLAASRRETTS